MEVVVPLRAQLAANVSLVVTDLLQTVSNVGEIGTVAHLLSSDLPNTLWNRTEISLLMNATGADSLPSDLLPTSKYLGPDRLFVVTRKPLAAPNSTLLLTAVVLSTTRPHNVQAYVRPLHSAQPLHQRSGQWAPTTMEAISLKQQAYRVSLPVGTEDVEWYVSANIESKQLYFPPAAPAQGQSVVVWDDGSTPVIKTDEDIDALSPNCPFCPQLPRVRVGPLKSDAALVEAASEDFPHQSKTGVTKFVSFSIVEEVWNLTTSVGSAQRRDSPLWRQDRPWVRQFYKQSADNSVTLRYTSSLRVRANGSLLW
jgi:hypothetical protein